VELILGMQGWFSIKNKQTNKQTNKYQPINQCSPPDYQNKGEKSFDHRHRESY